MTTHGLLAPPRTAASPDGSRRTGPTDRVARSATAEVAVDPAPAGEALDVRTSGRYLVAGVALEAVSTALAAGRVTGMDRPVPAVASIGLVVAVLLQAAGLIVLARALRGRVAARLAWAGLVAVAASVTLVAVAFAVTGYGAVLLAELWRGVSTADRPGPGGAYRLVESAGWDVAQVGLGGVTVLAFALAVLAAGGPRRLAWSGVLAGGVVCAVAVAVPTSGVLPAVAFPDVVRTLTWLWVAAAGLWMWRHRDVRSLRGRVTG